MKVVLFCGGLGMRMRDGVTNAPKPMAMIGDRLQAEKTNRQARSEEKKRRKELWRGTRGHGHAG